MIVQLVVKNKIEIPILLEDKEIADKVKNIIPYRTKVKIWKDEIYFEIPIEIKAKNLVKKVKSKEVCYWPPGRAMCIFFGISQPYTPVIPLGRAIGPLDDLKELSEEEEVILKAYNENEYRHIDLINKLKGQNINACLRKREEYETIVFNINNVGFEIYIEEYGYFMESEGLAIFEGKLSDMKVLNEINDVFRRYNYLRLDINEDREIVITTCSNDFNEILRAINETQKVISLLNKVIYLI